MTPPCAAWAPRRNSVSPEAWRLVAAPQAWLALWLGLQALALLGCGRQAPLRTSDPKVLRVGVSLSSGRLQRAVEASYGPLVRYLGEHLGMKAELVVAPTAQALNALFERGEVNLALLSGVDFVQVERRNGAVPLAARTLDAHFFSVVIARPGLAGTEFPKDFRGCSFLYAGVEASAGYRMPQFFFSRLGLVPKDFFRDVQHEASNAQVISAVEAGQADVGVMNGPMFHRLDERDPARKGRARVVWTSPTYVEAVWTVPAGTSLKWRERLLAAFLDLSPEKPAHADILYRLVARGFVPLSRASFDDARQALAEQLLAPVPP